MRVAVIGGGAAGMLAAAEAAQGGHAVSLFERNEKLGKKLYITGKGRCNVTNAADRDGFFAAVTHNPRFLYSAFSAFDNEDMQRLLLSLGVPLKTERGGRVFPASDKSSDILRALERHVRGSGVTVLLNARVEALAFADGAVRGLRVGGEERPFDAVIVATGGASYPQTGSTGDGYRFAEAAGHTALPPRPALVPLETEEDWPFALSGPLTLTLSSLIAEEPAGVRLAIDLKPALDEAQLDARLLRDLDGNRQKTVQGALHALLPARLLLTVLEQAKIDPATPVSVFQKNDRRRLLETLRQLPLTVRGARPLAEAVVTRGGVKVSEVMSSTMESKRMRGLYFAGEVLDVDALTGGYNLQIAWSTGALAGRSIGG